MKIPKEILPHFFLFSLTFLGFTSGHNLTDPEIRDYRVPKEVSSMFPYYLTGYDEDNAPVWLMNYGKFDIRTAVERGQGDLYDIWMEQFARRVKSSAKKDDELIGSIILVDLDDFSLRQITHLKSFAKILGTFEIIQRELSGGELKHGYAVNGNFLFERVWNLGRPLLGKLQAQVDFYGTNANIWKPMLLRNIPKNAIPEKLGGNPDFKPLEVYD